MTSEVSLLSAQDHLSDRMSEAPAEKPSAQKTPGGSGHSARRSRRQKGFTLVEVIVVLALFGVALAGVLVYQNLAERSNRTNNAINALITMVGTTKSIFAPANSYSNVNSTNLVNAGVPVQPFSGSGTTITDPWGGVLTVGGSAGFFGFGIAAPDRDTCMALTSALTPNAVRVTIGTSAPTFVSGGTTPTAFLTSGTVIKAGPSDTYNPAAATTACAGANPHIGLVFR